ncbi:hypothetical protein [Phaffia rhodozyma]|uniref:Uncharacterized protein n=1 Tax=Phaffia rhodozyma TaxID=264483 RepID=A0A0F7SJF8_PHARH|nr:hypothetical protein [Phaffia rhodozyma]
MPEDKYPNRRYKPDTLDEIYTPVREPFVCDVYCDCWLITATQGGQLGDFPLSELVAQSSGRAELRELQPSEFWKAAAAHGINTDNLVYRVSNMKLYVGTRDGETHWNLDEAMYKMGRNAEHHPLMDYIVIPEDPVSSGKLVTSMDEDASIVVSNILAEGHSKALRLDESTEDQSVGEEGEAETKAKL